VITLPEAKPLEWMGNSRRVVQAFPKPVRQVVGQALYAAQTGDTHVDTKPLKGFGGASVVEILADHDGDTFRAVYTVRFRRVVYMLHAFQKKSKKGIKTPQKELDLIKQRLRDAEHHYKEQYGSNKSK
jgi:phage-related protein